MVAKGMMAVAKAVCCPRDTMHSIPIVAMITALTCD